MHVDLAIGDERSNASTLLILFLLFSSGLSSLYSCLLCEGFFWQPLVRFLFPTSAGSDCDQDAKRCCKTRYQMLPRCFSVRISSSLPTSMYWYLLSLRESCHSHSQIAFH